MYNLHLIPLKSYHVTLCHLSLVEHYDTAFKQKQPLAWGSLLIQYFDVGDKIRYGIPTFLPSVHPEIPTVRKDLRDEDIPNM